MAHSLDAIVAYLAALAGGHAVLTMPSLEPRQASGVTDAFAPDLIQRPVAGRWKTVHATEQGTTLHPDLGLVMMTSGSTGIPKAVRLSTGNMEANAASIAEYLSLTATDRSCVVLPLHYCYGLSVLHSHLAVGASLYFPRQSIAQPGFLDRLEQSGCTNLSGVPYSYELLESIDFRNHIPASLRFMTVAGGRLSPDLIRKYNRALGQRDAELFVMYGQTEGTARLAYVPPRQLEGNESRIGIAVPGGMLSIEDDKGSEITTSDSVGELVYRGPNVMMGYATSRTDLARGAELDRLKTGDLAQFDEDGLFQICGRLKRISKIAGLRISHDAMEEALEKRGIRCAVVGNDTEIHAYCTETGREREVQSSLADASGLTWRQIGVTMCANLPRTAAGKIDYAELANRFAARSSDTDRKSETIQDIFAQLFYPARVRPQDTFLSLGGDSLRFVQLSIGLEDILGETPVNWETLSVAELSAIGRPAKVRVTLDTTFIIRALAILLVVLQHETLWPIPGGSAAMLILVGFGFARYQQDAILHCNLSRLFRSAIAVLIPYYLIVSAYAATWGDIPWASVFMVGNMGFADPERHTMVPYLYWFIEAYCQLILVFTAFFAIPAVRGISTRDPFAAGLVLLAAAIFARLVIPMFWELPGNRQIFTLPWFLYLATIGWLAALADTTNKRAMLLVIGSVIFVFFAFYESIWIGTRVKYMLQIPVLAALLFLPRIPLCKWAKFLIVPISAAGFHIYLLHRFAPELILASLSGTIDPVLFSIASVLGGVGLGLLCWWAQRRMLAILAKRPVLPTIVSGFREMANGRLL
ncbi:AMP-dependent synthetase [Rhizobium sp. Leaf453]|nr:AMP-dependent synthetase [Rhizobium sp. Leaf453]